ncbi:MULTISPECIES: hypothetical protein [Pseudoalteromonas]|uniref:hypothetical protein n=1 Tax=Pseudoalteromonas TaxID=53246 RepID=UPI00158236E1|nr:MULTISPECIES: hypothetical protein [Pseudoalteromonas]MDI4652628.1 hypothetical protein [Pseudoalteromonas shioyasakiensis]NUJ38662.1 hypothetical protein [Pseudoalteromonas sp. 0303]
MAYSFIDLPNLEAKFHNIINGVCVDVLENIMKESTFLGVTWLHINTGHRTLEADTRIICEMEFSIKHEGKIFYVQLSDQLRDVYKFYETVKQSLILSAKNIPGLRGAYENGVQLLEQWLGGFDESKREVSPVYAFDSRANTDKLMKLDL